MKYSVALLSGDPLGFKIIIRSADPDLIQHLVLALQNNRLTETDEADTLCDPTFFANANQILADVAAQTRQMAAAMFPEEADWFPEEAD